MKTSKPKNSNLIARVDPDFLKRFKVYCMEKEISMKDVLIELVDREMKNAETNRESVRSA